MLPNLYEACGAPVFDLVIATAVAPTVAALLCKNAAIATVTVLSLCSLVPGLWAVRYTPVCVSFGIRWNCLVLSQQVIDTFPEYFLVGGR